MLSLVLSLGCRLKSLVVKCFLQGTLNFERIENPGLAVGEFFLSLSAIIESVQNRLSFALIANRYGLNWRLRACTYYISIYTTNLRRMIRRTC